MAVTTFLSTIARAIATILYTHASTVSADARVTGTAGSTCSELIAPHTESQIANVALAVGVLKTERTVLAAPAIVSTLEEIKGW